MSEVSVFDWIIPRHMIENTPSIQDGFSLESEKQLRTKSVLFIEALGHELKCERLVVSTACVLFHRFFVFQSMAKHNRYIICATCLFLAAKVEESYRPAKDVASAYKVVRSKAINFNAETECNGLIEKLLLTERIVLQTLCFDLQIIHPYSSCLQKTKALKSYIPAESRREFHQTAVNFVNDSYRSSLLVQYQPHHVTIAALFLATLHLSLTPIVIVNTNSVNSKPQDVTWFNLLEPDIDENTLKDICSQILDIYDDHTGHGNLTGCSELRAKVNGGNAALKNKSEELESSKNNFLEDESFSSEYKSSDSPVQPTNASSSTFAMPTKTLSKQLPTTTPSHAYPPTPPVASPASSSPPPPPPDSSPGYFIQLSSTRNTPDFAPPPPPPSDTPLGTPYQSWSTSDHLPPPPPPPPSDTPTLIPSPHRPRANSEDESWNAPYLKRPRVEPIV